RIRSERISRREQSWVWRPDMRVPSLPALIAGLILLTFYTDLNADDPKGDFSAILRCVDELILGKWERATQIEGSDDTIEFTKDGEIAFVEKRVDEVRRGKGTYEQIETIRVDQGAFGKMFGYGTVVVKGTGGSEIECKDIGAPFLFSSRVQD